jgi:putative nucleotidyltransferase with HDIG domain
MKGKTEVIINRVRQFISAIASNITKQDQTFLGLYLNANEMKLFMAMDIPTQKHCLNVAYTCQRLSVGQTNIDSNTLLRAALLHDCGKLAGEVKTWHRVIIVLFDKLLPKLSDKLTKCGKNGSCGSLGQAFLIKSIHSARGAQYAKQTGVESQVVTLIREHHNHNIKFFPELLLLQQADDLN